VTSETNFLTDVASRQVLYWLCESLAVGLVAFYFYYYDVAVPDSIVPDSIEG
jgi:hypothetical protein